jgi:hypothetical protein
MTTPGNGSSLPHFPLHSFASSASFAVALGFGSSLCSSVVLISNFVVFCTNFLSFSIKSFLRPLRSFASSAVSFGLVLLRVSSVLRIANFFIFRANFFHACFPLRSFATSASFAVAFGFGSSPCCAVISVVKGFSLWLRYAVPQCLRGGFWFCGFDSK